MTMEERAALWDAINAYAETCGGDPSRHIYGNTPRQKAVAEVERLVRQAECHEDSKPADSGRNLQRAPDVHACEQAIRDLEALELLRAAALRPWLVDEIERLRDGWRLGRDDERAALLQSLLELLQPGEVSK